MEGEGPEEGPLDEPGGPQLPFDPIGNPAAPVENYYQERLNQNLRRGGRGCMMPWILAALIALAGIVPLARNPG
jgi:hypothetical protein